MKKYVIAFLLILKGFSYAYSQTRDKIQIPVFKENTAIDSLMEIVVKNRVEKIKSGNVIKFPKGSSFLLFIFDSKEYVSFQIQELSNSDLEKNINALDYDHRQYGVFRYNGQDVFVMAEKDLFLGFVAKTSNNRTFDFIRKTADHKSAGYTNHYSWHYKYMNGSFSIEGPPRIM